MKNTAHTKAQAPKPTVRPGRSKARLSRTQKRVPWLHWGVRNILVPTDFSDPSKKALGYAAKLAKQIGSKITLLHVTESVLVYPVDSYPVIMDYGFERANAGKAFRRMCKEEHVDPRLVRDELFREGTPHKEITDAAREVKADLIIIATNGHTGFDRVVLGSTTERVVRHAPCPVLVVREKEREFLRS